MLVFFTSIAFGAALALASSTSVQWLSPDLGNKIIKDVDLDVIPLGATIGAIEVMEMLAK